MMKAPSRAKKHPSTISADLCVFKSTSPKGFAADFSHKEPEPAPGHHPPGIRPFPTVVLVAGRDLSVKNETVIFF
jgi:hypothetical protein